jgi:AraC-like DNA-binding protein
MTTEETSLAGVCIFSPELIGTVSSHFKQYPLTSPVIRNVPQVYWELLKGIDKSSSIGKIKGFLYSVCDLFYERLDPTQEEKLLGRERLLREVLNYIEQNIHTPCALTTAAEELGYSSSYLSRAFSTMVGVPYMAYVRNAKINRACYLLKNTNGKIADIVTQCGYTSLATFHHNFKDLIGCNPTEYRQRNRL